MGLFALDGYISHLALGIFCRDNFARSVQSDIDLSTTICNPQIPGIYVRQEIDTHWSQKPSTRYGGFTTLTMCAELPQAVWDFA